MTDEAKSPRLEALLDFLLSDPDNHALLQDAASEALTCGAIAQANDLYTRAETIAPLASDQANGAGIAAMRGGDLARAGRHFDALLAELPEDPGLRFNRAWTYALQKDFESARALLDGRTTAALPQAAMLDIQLYHAAGEFDEAARRARAHLECHPHYTPLLGAISTLALDVEDEALARQCAVDAPDHPEAMITLGTLALADQDAAAARTLFDRSLAINANAPRGWIGRGLASLAEGRANEAGADLDRGAELFGDHLGSWIAAGWAYFVAGDHLKARARFEQALALDPSFAESHGSLAVMDILAGDQEGAERRISIATRLDRESFSAAFARMLMAQDAGDDDKVQAILQRALDMPLDDKGRTVGAAMSRMAVLKNRGPSG